LSDVKKSVSPVVNSESLQNRIAELEKENAEKTTQLEELEETTSREKAEFRRIHTNEMESHRREHQQSLEKVQRQAREAEEKADALQRQLQVLREEKQLLEKRRDELKAELLQTKDASEKAVSGLEHAQAITNATNTISTLQNELSTSTATIHQLRSALDSASHDADGLAETLEERAIQVQRLQHNVSDLEGANQALNEKVENLVSQMKTAEETAAGERAELCKKHTADIDAERHIGRNLQSSLESLQLEMGVTENKVTTLTREKNGLLEKVGKLEERCKNGQHQIAGLRTELTNANALVKDLEEKGKVAREDARKEKMALSNQVNLLRRQFEGAQKESGQRQDQIQRLEATKDDMTKELSRAQTSVSEKDAAIEELQQKNSVLEESRENLEERLVDMERTMVEARETAQSVLDEANRAHEREITRVRTRIQELQDELSSFITTAQQLHASLEVSHSDAQKAQQLAEERRDEIHRLQERVTALQDDVRSLEVKNDETISQMKSTEQAAREEKATILCSHAAEMQSQRTMVQTLKEGLELNLKEKEDELGLLVGEIGTLRTEVTTMKQRSRKDEVNIEAVQATLREVTERNKNSIERLEKEKVKVEEEAKTLTGRVLETLKELKACKAELDKLKNMTSFQKMADGFWYMFGASSSSAAAK
jgi:chromosome segregation ATPase